jgi:hypothetical protein
MPRFHMSGFGIRRGLDGKGSKGQESFSRQAHEGRAVLSWLGSRLALAAACPKVVANKTTDLCGPRGVSRPAAVSTSPEKRGQIIEHLERASRARMSLATSTDPAGRLDIFRGEASRESGQCRWQVGR